MTALISESLFVTKYTDSDLSQLLLLRVLTAQDVPRPRRFKFLKSTHHTKTNPVRDAVELTVFPITGNDSLLGFSKNVNCFRYNLQFYEY